MTRYLAFLAALLLPAAAWAQVCPAGSTCAPFETATYATGASSGPYSSGLFIPTVPSATASTLQHIPANVFVTLSDTQTLTNKTLTSPTIAGGALSGTFTGTPTLSGNLTFSGVPKATGLSSGTVVNYIGLDSGNNWVLGSGGSGGTPGGSSGQVQYNNSGSFGGFTTSGDATINTGTGALTLANTAVTPASYTNANITVDSKGRLTAASSGSAGGSISVSGGGNTTTGVSTVAFGNGFAVTPNGAGATSTVNSAPPIRTAATPTVATTDLAGTVNISSGGFTIPGSVFTTTGQTVLLVNYAGSTSALTNTSGLTVNSGGGCVSGTGILAGAGWSIEYNGTTLDCLQVISAASTTFANPSATAGPTAVNGSATTAMRSDAAPAIQKASSSVFGIVEVDNVTITASGGVISSVGGAATAITPGTTTVIGATAPCLIENSTSTTMACAVVTAGNVTLLGNTLNGSSGPIGNLTPTNNNCVTGNGSAWTSAACPGGGGSSAPAFPQGRLTLSTGKPVMQADVTAATTLYYDTYQGNQVPVWNGSSMTGLTIGSDEISMGLSTTNHAANTIHDVFGVNSSSTLVLCTVQWTNGTTRASAVSLKSGVWTITSAPSHCYGGGAGTTDYGSSGSGAIGGANQATLLGSMITTGTNGQTAMQFIPAAAAGGANAYRGIGNAYNTIMAQTMSIDNTSSWVPASTAYASMDASTSNRINYIDPLGQFPVISETSAAHVEVNGTYYIGACLDSTSCTPVRSAPVDTPNTVPVFGNVNENMPATLGKHYVQAVEAYGTAAGTTYGSYGLTTPSGLTANLAY